MHDLLANYLRRYRIIVVCTSTLLLVGAALVLVYLQSPNNTTGNIALAVGTAFVTGVLFSLLIPLFVGETPSIVSDDTGIVQVQTMIRNHYLGLGRVWQDENDFAADFRLESHIASHDWSTAYFVGVSLTRLLSTVGHVIESHYIGTARDRWRPCHFIVAHPGSPSIVARIKNRPEAKNEVEQSALRIAQIRKNVAEHHGLPELDVPLHLHYSTLNIQFGLYFFSPDRSVLTFYAHGLPRFRSYYNPRVEVIHEVTGTGRSVLGRWVDGYVRSLLEHADKQF